MKIIITGGAGLLGTALALDLIQDGHEVIALTRNPERVKDVPAGMQIVKWDGCTAQGWGGMADGADAIVNLAGENLSAGRWTSSRKQRILESRVNAGKAITQAIEAAENKPRVVIQSSAVGYYGIRKAEGLTEVAPAGDDFLAQVCQVWEASSQTVEALGVRRCVIRSAVLSMSVRHPGSMPPGSPPDDAAKCVGLQMACRASSAKARPVVALPVGRIANPSPQEKVGRCREDAATICPHQQSAWTTHEPVSSNGQCEFRAFAGGWDRLSSWIRCRSGGSSSRARSVQPAAGAADQSAMGARDPRGDRGQSG